jgi:hypothetical protein
VARNNTQIDILEDGNLSCAKVVSAILFDFQHHHNIHLIDTHHATVDGLIKDLLRNKRKQYTFNNPDALHVGDVLERELSHSSHENIHAGHKHIGFFVGNEQAFSNSSAQKVPIFHHITYENTRAITTFYRHTIFDT